MNKLFQQTFFALVAMTLGMMLITQNPDSVIQGKEGIEFVSGVYSYLAGAGVAIGLAWGVIYLALKLIHTRERIWKALFSSLREASITSVYSFIFMTAGMALQVSFWDNPPLNDPQKVLTALIASFTGVISLWFLSGVAESWINFCENMGLSLIGEKPNADRDTHGNADIHSDGNAHGNADIHSDRNTHGGTMKKRGIVRKTWHYFTRKPRIIAPPTQMISPYAPISLNWDREAERVMKAGRARSPQEAHRMMAQYGVTTAHELLEQLAPRGGTWQDRLKRRFKALIYNFLGIHQYDLKQRAMRETRLDAERIRWRER